MGEVPLYNRIVSVFGFRVSGFEFRVSGLRCDLKVRLELVGVGPRGRHVSVVLVVCTCVRPSATHHLVITGAPRS